jgi:hypothetical protein
VSERFLARAQVGDDDGYRELTDPVRVRRTGEFVGTPRVEDGWSPPMTALGTLRRFASMNPIAFIEATGATRSAVLGALANPVVRDRRFRVRGLF